MPPASLQAQCPFFVLPFCRSAVLPLTAKLQSRASRDYTMARHQSQTHLIWDLQYTMLSSVFIQSRNWGFNRDRLVSPEPAFILARETLRAHPPGESRVPCKGRFAVFDHQDPPVEELTPCCTCVGFTADAFALIDNHFDGLFFKMHGPIPPLPLFPSGILR